MMDIKEQNPNTEKTTQQRVRLPRPRKQLMKTVQRMEKLAQSGTLKETKLADLLIEMGGLQKLLFQTDLHEKQEDLRHENESLKAELAEFKSKLDTTVDDDVTRMLNGWHTSTINALETQVERLKQQNSTLQDVNTGLAAENAELKTKNSEHDVRFQRLEEANASLQESNLTLQVTIDQLRSRTPTELVAEAKAKMDKQREHRAGT